MQRRSLLLALFFGAAAIGCGGPGSTLHTLGTPSGSGEIRFEVENKTSVIINNLYLVPTAKVKAAPRSAFEPGNPDQAALWGRDLLRSGLEVGGKVSLSVPGPGSYDLRAVDRDGRDQHVAGLRLRAGGRYVLELGDGSFRPAP